MVEQQAETTERITARQAVELGRTPHLGALSPWSNRDTDIVDHALDHVGIRLLKPGGKLLVFDGDWARPTTAGRLATWAIRQIDRVIGPDNHYDGALSDRHATVMQNLPFGDGLTVETLLPMLKAAGFQTIERASHQPIAAAQRRTANLRNCLRTVVYQRFILCAHKPD